MTNQIQGVRSKSSSKFIYSDRFYSIHFWKILSHALQSKHFFDRNAMSIFVVIISNSFTFVDPFAKFALGFYSRSVGFSNMSPTITSITEDLATSDTHDTTTIEIYKSFFTWTLNVQEQLQHQWCQTAQSSLFIWRI